MFLYKQFMGRDLGQLQFDKTNKGRRLPTVFSHDEAMRVFSFMEDDHKLMASLMYGSGLRMMEAVRLRAQDVDFGLQCLIIRFGAKKFSPIITDLF